jgi:FKBP-type peptidyl-prolyl cis-trans isomerase
MCTAAFLFISLQGCTEKAQNAAPSAQLVTTADTISYIIGTDLARSLKTIKDEIVPDIVFEGMRDQLADAERRIDPEQERIIMQAFSMRMQQRQKSQKDEEAAKNLKESNDFLAENGKKESVVTTKSGLQYIVLKEGDGPKPSDTTDNVTVNYEGKLLNGKIFDSSLKRGKPATFHVNRVIKGWQEALMLMKVGSKYQLFIPPDLAYGKRGMPHDIKPNMMLIFEVELLDVKKAEAK